MQFGITDKNGDNISLGDTLVFPYIAPNGNITTDVDFTATVEFEHGCVGYHGPTRFVPLIEWQFTKVGDYIPNEGNMTVYTESYPFWILTQSNESKNYKYSLINTY